MEPVIEMIEELIETPGVFAQVHGLQQQGTEGRCKGQCHKGRQEHRDGDGDGKLLIEATGDARYKAYRYEYRRQDEGDSHYGAGDILHGPLRGFFSRESLLIHVVLDRLHHHDGVIHHDTDGQHESEHGQGIDGKAQWYEEDECPDNGYGDGQHGDQGRSPALEEEEDHQYHQTKRFQQGVHHFTDGYLHHGYRFERHHVVDPSGEIFFQRIHRLIDAFRCCKRVTTGRLLYQQVAGPLTIHERVAGVAELTQLDARYIT